MADLNKALSHIVVSLTHLLSNINTNNLETANKRVRKSPDVSYQQFLTEVLAGRETPNVRSPNCPYSLQQDLQILLHVSSAGNISIKTFQELVTKRRVKRSPDSMLARYSQVLHKVEEKDIKKIVNWVQEEGVTGYLGIQNGEFTLSLNEPLSGKKRQRPVSLQKQAQSQQRSKKSLKGLKIPNNCKELNEILKVYSKMVNIPMKTLLIKLHQVSGDLVELDNYIETKDARLLWSAAEDEILKKGGPELEIMKRYRGSTIQSRKKYLGL